MVYCCTLCYCEFTLEILFVYSYRLKEELEGLIKDQCLRYHATLGSLSFKFHEPPAHPNCAAWLGGMLSETYVVVVYSCVESN